MQTKYFILPLATAMLLQACASDGFQHDASGVFEAKEIMVAVGVAGKIEKLNVEEGDQLQANSISGFIDTAQLYLKKQQLDAQIKAILSRQPEISTQLAAIQEQIKTAQFERQRAENLVKAGAATQKQLDDIDATIRILQSQLAAQESNLTITTSGLHSEVGPLNVQIAQVNDQLLKSYILNPVKGTVLAKYAEEGEFTNPGKAIYKIADLSDMTLRAYIDGTQLGQIKLGQTCSVFINQGETEKEMEGTIYWISDKAEFTPKTIQTKDERANLVYAIKIRVPNDGSIKIGMYGEIDL